MSTYYIVRWCNHEGNLRESPPFDNLEDAKLEAQDIASMYDGAEVVTPFGERLWPAKQDEDCR